MEAQQTSLFEWASNRSQAGVKHWIHRLPAEALQLVFLRKTIGSKSTRARTVKQVGQGDWVVLATTLARRRESGPPVKQIAFVGIGRVAGVSEESQPIAGYDKHKRKIRLATVRFFVEPLWLKDAAAKGLSLFAGKSKLSDAMDFEYRDVPADDFQKLIKNVQLVDSLPAYLRASSLDTQLTLTDHQLLQVFKLSREMVRAALGRRRGKIEIRLFLRAVAGFLSGIGVDASYDAVYQRYRVLARQTGFRHSPSRDPDLQVELLDKNGRPTRHGYIDLRR